MDSSIKFNVSANTAQFQSGMKQVDATAKSTAAGIKQAFSGVQSMLVGGAMVAGLKNLMNDFDKVAKVATRFGASAEEIQRVSVAADLAGTSIDTVARVLTKMSVAASDASSGNENLAKAFEKAGINAEQFKNSGLDRQLVLLSEAFNRARGDADATNQIIELMGTRAASQMIPLIDNTAALRQEMQGVSVASDDVVRKIEAANDRLTRFGNDGKVALAGLIEGFVSTSERLGSVISDQDKLLKLLAALPLALTGNIKPLWEVLQTGKTIAEMEEVEARATAIAQLTREGVFGMDAVKNAELIAGRTKEILEQTRGTNQQISIAEDMTERVVDLEKQKTVELDRQAEQLERQERQRQDAIRSMEAEVALIEAKLSGNKALEESLREQADFQAALEKTGSFETAANFAATKAAERRAQEAERAAAAGSIGGGGFAADEPDRPLTQSQRVAQMRARAAEQRTMGRAPEFQGGGMFRSSVRREMASERAGGRVLENQQMRDMAAQFDFAGRSAGNVGEAMKSVVDEMGKMGFLDTLREGLGKEFDRAASLEENFQKGAERGLFDQQRDFERDAEGKMRRMADEQAKTPDERKREEEEARSKSKAPGGGTDGQQGILQNIQSTLSEFKTSMEERLPQTAMTPN